MTSSPGPENDPLPPGPPSPDAEPTPESSAPQPQPEPQPQPQKLRLHPAATLIDAFGFVRAAVLPVLILLFGQGLLVGLAVAVGLIVVGVIFGLISWRTEVYFVAEGSLHHQSGVIRHREEVVPASRISALDTQRGIIQRIFGIVAVQVQTAGGGSKAEIELRAITFAAAEQLRHDLGHRASNPQAGATSAAASGQPPAASSGATAADDDQTATPADSTPTAWGDAPSFVSPNTPAEDAPVVFQMTPREILVAALTSPSIAVVGAAGAALASAAQDALPDSTTTQLANEVDNLTVMAGIVLGLGLLVVAAVVSIAGTALLYGGFKVTRDDTRLRIRRGILTERVGTVPLDRIHAVRVIESPLRQLLGYASIEVEVAGYAGQDEVSRTIVPLVRRTELAETLTRVVPNFTWPEGQLAGIPARARRRYLTVPLLVAAIPAIALAAAPIGVGRAVAIVPLLLAVAAGRLAAREAGWRREHGMLTLRSRRFARSTVVATERRLQRASTSINPFQRRAALATFAVRFSSARGAGIRHLDETVARELLATAQSRHHAA
ncbi:MAG: PH domain-containing protein [Solirubrobacteraceae bacterium]|nr:PH domain-containing protein [Solirubrobacteraceae bacterium]